MLRSHRKKSDRLLSDFPDRPRIGPFGQGKGGVRHQKIIGIRIDVKFAVPRPHQSTGLTHPSPTGDRTWFLNNICRRAGARR